MSGERLARSGVISLVSSAVAALAALLLTSIVGNRLGASGTGVFFQAVGIFTILTQLLRLGTNSGVVRFISEQRAFDRVGAEWRIVAYAAAPVALVSGIASIMLWLLAGSLSQRLASPADQTTLEGLLVAMAPFVLAGSLIGVFHMASRMLRGVAAFSLLQSVLLPLSRLGAVLLATLTLATVGAAFKAWLWPIPIWLFVTAAVVAAPIFRDFRRRRQSAPTERPSFVSFWQFNAPRALNSGLEAALEWSDVLIVAAVASPSAAGVYAVATRTVRAGGVVDKAMRVAVAPTTSEFLARGETQRSSRLHTSVVRAMILLNWPFYLLLISMGGSVLLIFGEDFVVGWGPMGLIAAATMFQTAAGMLQSILLQGGRSTWQMYNKALALALSIAGNLALVPFFGLWGAAITWMIVMTVDNAIAAYQVHHRMHVHLQPRQLIAPALVPVGIYGIGGALFTVLGGVSLANVIVASMTLTVLYAVVLWILRSPLGIRALWRKVPLIGGHA